MSQHLPVGGFKWVRTEFLDLKKFENQIRSWRPHQKKGYILEVDLEYPQELHDLHNDYPLAPEKSKVPRAKYSRYQQELADHLNIGEDDTEKLLLTLNDKKELRSSLSNYPAVSKVRDEAEKGASDCIIHPNRLDEGVHRLQHTGAGEGNNELREGLIQADEQLRLRQDNGEPAKPGEREAGER